MNVKEEILGEMGMPIRIGRGETLDSIDRDTLAGWVAESGYVVLRNYEVDLARFSAFVKQNSTRISLDPARLFHGADGRQVAQKVDAGMDALGLHCENGNSPFWPDLCWFYCDVAPSIGSQTTVCDGIGAFQALTPAARRAFKGRDIVYTRRVREPLWKTYAMHGGGGAQDDTRELFARLRALVNDRDSTQLELEEDASITYRFRTSAVLTHSAFRPAFQAFANSIFGPSFNYERPVITFADGAAIDSGLLDEAAAACAQHTREIDWHVGDLVVIDNRRVMHGRRAIEDRNRSIFNALSYV